MDTFFAKLLHATLYEDNEILRKARLSATLNIAWIIVGLVYIPLYALMNNNVGALLITIGVFFATFNLLFLRIGWLRTQANTILFIVWYVLVCLSITGLQSLDAANAWFATLSLIAFLLLGQRSGIVWLGLSICGIAIVYATSQSALLVFPQPPERYVIYASLFHYVGICIFVFCLAHEFSINYNRAINEVEDILEALKVEKKQADIAREMAIESSRVKGEFLANMSHEIRTPMNGVLGMADLLLLTELDDEQEDIASTILSSAESLLRIINDILDISKLEAGKIVLVPTVFDIKRMIEELFKIYVTGLTSKDINHYLKICPTIPTPVIGDSDRLKQVLINLIGNAVKFTKTGGTVGIEVTKKSETESTIEILFAVEDTGIGIAEDKQKQIFDSFSQADGTITRKFGGTGLGLSIAMQLVQLMGGTIWLESEEGTGSTFFFTTIFEKRRNTVPLINNALV